MLYRSAHVGREPPERSPIDPLCEPLSNKLDAGLESFRRARTVDPAIAVPMA